MMIEKLQTTGARLLKLRKKLAARENTPGYEKNCEALRAEIARLEGSTARPATGTTSGEQSETATETMAPESAPRLTNAQISEHLASVADAVRGKPAVASKSGSKRRAKPGKVTE